jgi:hypothetical protein
VRVPVPVPMLVRVPMLALMVTLVLIVVGAGLDRFRALNEPQMPVRARVRVLVHTPSVAMQYRRARSRHAVNRSHRDGAFMEQSGRNRWHPIANGMAAKTARTSQNCCRGLPLVADRSAW